MEAFFGYYFGGIVGFSALSWIILAVYWGLITDDMSARYPDEFKKILGSGYEISRRNPWRTVRAIKNLGDDKLNNLASKSLFWLHCVLSISITGPVGMVVFLILKHSGK